MINGVLLRVIESVLAGGFLLLSLRVLSLTLGALEVPAWLPDGLSEVTGTGSVIVMLLSVAAYWALGLLGQRSRSFWLLAAAGLSLQLPAVLSHNRLDWLFFFAGQRWFSPPASSLELGGYFLLSLAVLVLLYRSIGLEEQQRSARRQGIGAREYRRLMLDQYLFMAGLVSVSLILAAGLVLLSAVLGGIGGLLERWPWTVLTVGGVATLLVSATLLYWMRDTEAG